MRLHRGLSSHPVGFAEFVLLTVYAGAFTVLGFRDSTATVFPVFVLASHHRPYCDIYHRAYTHRSEEQEEDGVCREWRAGGAPRRTAVGVGKGLTVNA